MFDSAILQGVSLEAGLSMPNNEKLRLFLTLADDKSVLYSLSKNKLKKLQKLISNIIKTKYSRRRVPKYGLFGAKTMDLEEIDRFFSAFKPHEWRMKVLFLVQAFLGLRIGEVIKIKLEDIDFVNKQIKIRTEKQKHYETDLFMALHEKLEALLLEYVTAYESEIKTSDGCLFFSDGKGKAKHISSAYARKFFRKICKRAGLTQTYGSREIISEPKALKLFELCENQPKSLTELTECGFSLKEIEKIRKKYADFFKFKDNTLCATRPKLYRYTTHSLRHAFGKYLAKRGVPIEIAKHLLRHQDIKSTQIYYIPDKEQVDATMHNLFTFPERKKY